MSEEEKALPGEEASKALEIEVLSILNNVKRIPSLEGKRRDRKISNIKNNFHDVLDDCIEIHGDNSYKI